MGATILGAQQTAIETRKGQSSFLADAPRWFIVVLGIAYATGFVVVSTFLDSFGVQNATSDLLKLKYLQVGFFFLLFLGSVIILTVCVKKGLELQRQALAENQTNTGTVKDNARAYLAKMYPQRILIWINVLVAIYLAVGFAPPHSASKVLPPVTVLLVVAVTGSIGITALGSKYAAGNKDLPRLIWVLRWILLLTLALIDG